MITLASYLAENARPTYESIAAYLRRRLGVGVELATGIAWEERLRMLDDGHVHVGFLCGWPYSQRFDRPERPIEPRCAPVMAAPRYQGRPIYFTDVIVRADSPVRSFADLRGRSYAYNGAESHSGYNVPRDHLLALGGTAGYGAENRRSGAGREGSAELLIPGTMGTRGFGQGFNFSENDSKLAAVSDQRCGRGDGTDSGVVPRD